MRMLTGALVLVAGAVVYAAGVVADAIICHRRGTAPDGPDWAIGVGIVVGLIGVGVLISGWLAESRGTNEPPAPD
jgi:hypothetical protein